MRHSPSLLTSNVWSLHAYFPRPYPCHSISRRNGMAARVPACDT